MAVDEINPLQCANPDCKVSAGGKCFEGFADAATCPQFGKTLVVLEVAESTKTESARLGVPLSLAEALTLAEAEQALRSKPCNVVAIVGPQDAGKTSLIASIYDLLQEGPLGSYSFAGSDTLHAFERACHDSRRESQRDKPHMERTKLGEVTFFDLNLFDADCSRKHAALLANRAGEDYINVLADPDLARSYAELGRADTITVLADGEKLLGSERHLARRDMRLTIRAFQEVSATRPWQRLGIVLTKVDAIRSNQEKGAGAFQFFDELVNSVRMETAGQFMEVKAFQVAASPKSDKAKRGEGMLELLQFWMLGTGRHMHSGSTEGPALAARAYGRLRPYTNGNMQS